MIREPAGTWGATAKEEQSEQDPWTQVEPRLENARPLRGVLRTSLEGPLCALAVASIFID